MKLILFLCAFATSWSAATAQYTDTVIISSNEPCPFHIPNSTSQIQVDRPRVKTFIIPSVLIAYGFIALDSDPLETIDMSMKNEIREDHPHFHTTVDNYSQYAPAIAVYVLNAMGVKGKNNFRDRTMIYLLANAITGVTVQSIKAATGIPRPDGGHNAFPSGHTATAFTAAEFLRQEYKEVSPWYGIAGYIVAAGTGTLRMYNNVHWFKDILAGAGIGMLGTRAAYWIYPSIEKKLFHQKPIVTMLLPSYGPNGFGVNGALVVKL